MIFGFGREPEREEPTAYEIAVAHYKSLRESMPSDTLRLQLDQPTAEFPRKTYLLAKQEDAWLRAPWFFMRRDRFAVKRDLKKGDKP